MEVAMSTQDAPARAFGTYFSTEWRQLVNSWPIAMIAFGAIISFGWAVLLLWLLWGLLNLAF
jgi:hypothetical protein